MPKKLPLLILLSYLTLFSAQAAKAPAPYPFAPHSSFITPAQPILTNRGFTFHEHLEDFGLIHMNGRIYDPVLGMFLSPDNYVQAPDFTQSLNRYAYAWNNPLLYVDPSGEILIELMIFCGLANTIMNAGNISNFGQGLGYFATGAAASAAGGLAGQAIQMGGFLGGALSGAVGGFAGGLASGAGNAWMGGASFTQGMNAGFKTGLTGALTGGILGGISGGLNALENHSNFWTGSPTTGPATAFLGGGGETYGPFSLREITVYGKDLSRTGAIAGAAGAAAGMLVNPTGHGIRNDSEGLGHYGAPRGNRTHRGIDFATTVGQDIYSPIAGKVVHEYGRRKGDRVDIYPSDPAEAGFDMIRILYVDRATGVQRYSTANVQAGAVIGVAADLQNRGYSPLITPHIHLQIQRGYLPSRKPNWIDPTPFFFKP
jgi:RHS repeat-associated protein